ncbi:MAG: DUF4291 domain-containing protein [Chloroflexota bacterium]
MKQGVTRQIYASYDDEGITVYQAYKPEIAQAALRKGRFAEGFGFDRMTWIKPSFGWMLYRSGYATKPNQESILKIKLAHAGWRAILHQSVESVYVPEQYADENAWKRALAQSEVRHQWDPERQINGHKLERRAIQVGISGQTVRAYVDQWIIRLEDVTALAHAIHDAVSNQRPLPDVPEERLYPVDADLQTRLGITET